MQIIQSIRERGAAITVAVIVLCLIGFILMDSRPGGNSVSSSQTIGKVNGEKIDQAEFNNRVIQMEEQEAQQSGQKPTGTRLNQIREQLWNQITAEKIFYAEIEKLGIELTPKELSAILMSNDQNNPFLREQGMVDQAGKIDVAKVQEALRNIKKGSSQNKDQVYAMYIDPLKLTTAVAKYSGLLNASAYYPAWMQAKDNADAKNFATISYVAIPYTDISDSTIKVTDEDVNDYVKKNETLFKQEAGRTISYLNFSQLPTAADSLLVYNELDKLKAAFAADSNEMAFVGRNVSAIDYNDKFLPKAKIQSSKADTITKNPVGSVYGPYVDADNYVIAKVVKTSIMPDSVRARHILIPINNPQTGQPIMADSTAKRMADSVLNAIKGGADFAALALKYSSDGSKEKGGDLGFFEYGKMVPEFNDFSFTKSIGSTELVQTQFGYHIIEVLAQKDMKPAYKIAYVAKPIVSSQETVNAATQKATTAAGEKTAADLSKYAAKNGLKIVQSPAIIKENDFSVGALQDARALVRWAFEAKKGEVSEPFNIGDDIIVASVDNVYKEGLQDAAAARSGAEVIIRKQKKAAMIIAKLGANPTLETAGAAYGKQIMQAGADSSITFNSQLINGVGMEQKIIGASFNKEYQAKPSPAIEGTTGVFVIKVIQIGTKPADVPEVAAQQVTSKLGALRSQTNNWFEGLKKQADIKDNRSKFF
ncbi:MAG: peptidylprolyl isomerase [Rhizobacter sp.]|nr:peptidylprolyl isomerase [Ferruginibacter sp.]